MGLRTDRNRDQGWSVTVSPAGPRPVLRVSTAAPRRHAVLCRQGEGQASLSPCSAAISGRFPKAFAKHSSKLTFVGTAVGVVGSNGTRHAL